MPIVRLGEGKESLDQHRCQDLENSINPDEWNTDDTDKLKPQFTRYRASFACPSFDNLTDTHGFGASICDISFS
jgi:hypothetical protein